MPRQQDVPKTPSPVINNMLAERCGKFYSNPVKETVASFILIVFNLITKIYTMLHPNKNYASHRYWVISCGIVSACLMIFIIIGYNLLIWSSFILHSFLYYFAYLLCLFGVGLGVSGMVFFDKGAKATEGFEDNIKSTGSSFKSDDSFKSRLE